MSRHTKSNGLWINIPLTKTKRSNMIIKNNPAIVLEKSGNCFRRHTI